MLEEFIATNEEGQQYTLAELSDLSVSNPEIRRGELMLRIAGFDELAIEADHARDFWTLTCPSRFHSHRSKSGDKNPKHKGQTPRDAQEWLCKVWARVRAKLARDRGLKLYGFRVAEPHHDGCTHWHMAVFLPKKDRHYARGIMARYALEDCPEEDPRGERRFVAKSLPDDVTAAGYLAKYIAKNIAGHAVSKDLLGDDINKGMLRVAAWAACWGIKQFQQIGTIPVTVWRELRRMNCEQEGVLEEARAAADNADWAKFVRVMGGATARRNPVNIYSIQLSKKCLRAARSRVKKAVKAKRSKTRIKWFAEAKKILIAGRDVVLEKRRELAAEPVIAIHPAYRQEIKTDTGEIKLNKYGEIAAGRVVGVRVKDVYHITRWHKWSIERGKKNESEEKDKEADLHLFGSGVNGLSIMGEGQEKSEELAGHALRSFDGLGFSSLVQENFTGVEYPPPWCTVNNCTALGGENLMYDTEDIHQYQQLAARPPD